MHSSFHVSRPRFYKVSMLCLASFLVNELSKQYFAKVNNVAIENLSVPDRLLSGAAAGIGYWVCTYPLDVVKVCRDKLLISLVAQLLDVV